MQVHFNFNVYFAGLFTKTFLSNFQKSRILAGPYNDVKNLMTQTIVDIFDSFVDILLVINNSMFNDNHDSVNNNFQLLERLSLVEKIINN